MSEIPNGPPIPMDQFTLGKVYGALDSALDSARACGCEFCRQFIAQHELQQTPFYSTVDSVTLGPVVPAYMKPRWWNVKAWLSIRLLQRGLRRSG